jgi:hypothetical protein
MVKFHFFVDIIARIGFRVEKIEIKKNTVADMGLIYWICMLGKKIKY